MSTAAIELPAVALPPPPELRVCAAAGREAYGRWLDRRPVSTAVVEVEPRGTPCPRGNLWQPSCKRRDCRVCGGRWSQNVYTVIRSALEAVGGPVTVIAITPPGKDRGLPWDRERCLREGLHGPRAQCSGPRYGCRVQDRALREWSATLTWRASKLRKAAYMALKRSGLNVNPRWLERVWEPQRRGAAHLHIVLGYGDFAEKRVAKAYVAELKRLAPEYGFGNVDGHLKSWTAKEAARYLSSYLTGRSSKQKATMRANLADPNLPSSLFWVSPRLTGVTHVTMRSLRRARHLFASRRDSSVPEPRWSSATEGVKAVAAFRRVFLRKTPEEGGDPDIAVALELATRVDRELRELKVQRWTDWYLQRETVRDFASELVGRLLPQDVLAATA